MAQNRLFLLDALALLYRAHFAFIKNPRINSQGFNTSAIFGFTNTLLEIITKENPSHLAVVFDTSAPTFRHKEYPPYKANREAMPEALSKAIPVTIKLLKALNIATLSLDGYEADDIIGTISKQAPANDYHVFMVTPDKDYAQLVKENVFMFKPPRKQSASYEVLGIQQVVDKFGFEPKYIIDFLALKGDSVDNIPGVPKIGDKTALSLITEFGHLENILENIENIKRKAVKKTLTEHAEQGKLSKRLATIFTEVPIEYSWEDLKVTTADLEALMPLLQELEFRNTSRRILNSKLNPVIQAKPTSKDLFGNPINPEPPILKIESPYKTLEDIPHQYHLLQTPEARAQLILRIKEKGYFCFDTETTSLDPLRADLVGISLAIEPHEAFFIHFPYNKPEVKEQLLAELTPIFTDTNIAKIGQNLKYDCLVLHTQGLAVEGQLFDTMIAHYVLEPSGKHGMDAMAQKYLKYQTISIESLIGKKGKKQKTMRSVPLDKIVPYACEDADITLQLYHYLSPKVKDNKVFEEIDAPLVPVLTAMEVEGINLDSKALGAYSIELGKLLTGLEADIHKLAGEEFNVNSPRQLGEIIFGKLKLAKGKKTKSGQFSTNERILTNLASKHDLPAKVLEYRSYKKLKSTYVDALPQLVNPDTQRIHSSFNQTVAVTGRLSSTDPNLQNIPIRKSEGREVRKGFIPRNENFKLLSADYSQVELRIMAALSKEPNMIKDFQAKLDIHSATAARVFGVSMEEVDSEMRAKAKMVNFGIIYGISAFGLAQRLKISPKEGKAIIEAYFEKYPGIKAYMDQCVTEAREKGCTETLFGRKRYLPEINSRNATIRGYAERNAINSPIQGTAADIIKLAMIRIHKRMAPLNLQSKMLLQVHDELVFDVHKDEIELMKQLVEEEMVAAVELSVPMEVSMGIGTNWLEAH